MVVQGEATRLFLTPNIPNTEYRGIYRKLGILKFVQQFFGEGVKSITKHTNTEYRGIYRKLGILIRSTILWEGS